MQGFSFVEDSFLSKDANREIQLLNQVQGDQSFQASKPNIKIAEKSKIKSEHSIQSKESQKVLMKARINVSGDRSIDMFASDFNSFHGGA